MARQEYGVTPWGAWFADILDSYNMGERINRGRSYANTGKVLDCTIAGQTVTAKIKGNYAPFYTVSITFPPLSARDKTQLTELLKGNPARLAEIASGELSETFLEELKQNKIELIPSHWDDMKRVCNCPDNGDPCKHMAALYFILARAIDADPNILFKFRGIDLNVLCESFNAQISDSIPPPFIPQKNKSQHKTENSAQHEKYERLNFYEIPSCINLITSLLPPHSQFYPAQDFNVLLTQFYHEAAHYVSWLDFDSSKFDERRASHSKWSVHCTELKAGAALYVLEETIYGERIGHELYSAFIMLSNVSIESGTESFVLLARLCKFIHAVIVSGAFVPYPLVKNGKLQILWVIYEQLSVITDCKKVFAQQAENLLLIDNKNEKAQVFASGETAVNMISSRLLTEWVSKQYFAYKNANAVEQGFLRMFFQNETRDVRAPAERNIPLAIWRYVSVFSINFRQFRYRITLKEAKNKKQINNDNVEPAALILSMSMDVLLEKESGLNGISAIPLKDAAKKTRSLDVLKAPLALSAYLPEIKTLTENYSSVTLPEERLVMFLNEAEALLSRLGVEAVLPKALRNVLKPRLVLQTGVKDASSKTLKNYLSLPSLLEWNWEIAIGGLVLSEAEFKKLLKQKNGIVKFKDKFVSIDAEELASLFRAAQLQKNKSVSANEFLKNYFSGGALLSFDAEEIIKKMMAERKDEPPDALQAELRPYQKAGFRWVLSLLTAGFGCILADDMGLGKTIQAIAVILQLKKEGLLRDSCLVVCPAALLENWAREFERFAPSLWVMRYHGKSRRFTSGVHCYITTYQTAALDKTKLAEKGFSILVADEAHLLKNAQTKSSKAVKEIRANFRLALSGTPVENRLEDMRSLFDLVLPGYLGTAEEFLQKFRKPVEVMRDKSKAAELQKITAPFLLRRLKTDKTIIADLPDKIIKNEYAALSKEQTALYESVINTIMDKIEKIENKFERAGLIFNLLTSLKQICDHPRVYDKESPAEIFLSGKAELLVTLLDEALCAGEKTLIFSQYVEALLCLHPIIKKELSEEALIYHGSLSQHKRAAIVERFQNDDSARILLISLKAGGLGLNLTAANRVIHYDLWYNPAVESQAEDRVFRIGQKRNVFVHRFITKNSFEEKIDAMLTSKRELAALTVASGEAWLSRLSQSELRSLFER